MELLLRNYKTILSRSKFGSILLLKRNSSQSDSGPKLQSHLGKLQHKLCVLLPRDKMMNKFNLAKR